MYLRLCLFVSVSVSVSLSVCLSACVYLSLFASVCVCMSVSRKHTHMRIKQTIRYTSTLSDADSRHPHPPVSNVYGRHLQKKKVYGRHLTPASTCIKLSPASNYHRINTVKPPLLYLQRILERLNYQVLSLIMNYHPVNMS
jgi:hypothetical protein